MGSPMNQTGKYDNSIPPDDSPTDDELRAEVYRLMHTAAGRRPPSTSIQWVNGKAVVTRDRAEPDLPTVGSREWWVAPERVRIASLVGLAAAYLVADPELRVRRALREMIWQMHNELWWRVSTGVSHAERMRRWYPPTGDPEEWIAAADPNPSVADEAMRHWLATGNSA